MTIDPIAQEIIDMLAARNQMWCDRYFATRKELEALRASMPTEPDWVSEQCQPP
jgi:hypothetical protein